MCGPSPHIFVSKSIMLQDYYQNASLLNKLLVKVAIIYGFILTTAYLVFRAYYINISPALVPFSILLYLAELHTLILIYGLLYSLWPRNYKVYSRLNTNKNLQINIFITVCGEPTEIVYETIKSAKKAAEYYLDTVKPRMCPRVIVLNDGKAANKENWKEIENICKDLGVEHVARNENAGFKAGNINNGLRLYPAADPHNTIDCFFDADFSAKKEFLLEILKPLADKTVDFVQSPQRYKNLNTWVAQAAGAHQIFFFDYICPAKAHDNALFLCGTNYAIRRKALLDVNEVDNRFVTEDYATSIKLHLNAKKGVFVSKVLAKGLAPMNLKEYFNQQTRWCKGCLDANRAYFKELFFGKLNWRQRFHYFLSTAYYFIGIRDAVLVLAPIPYLFYGVSLIRANTIEYLAFIYLPLVVYNFFLFFLTFRNPIKSLVLDVVAFPVFAKAFLASVVGKNLPFTITIKKYEKEDPFKVYSLQLAVAMLLAIGLIFSTLTKTNYNIYGKFINHFWASYSASFLFIGFWLVMRENYNLSKIEDIFLYSARASIYAAKRYIFQPVNLVFASLVILLFIGNAIKDRTLAYEDVMAEILPKNEKIVLLVPGGGVYYGYYLPELNSHPTNPKVNFLDGEQPSLTMYYQDWSSDSNFNIEFMNSLYNKGVVPIVTWEPWIRDGGDDIPLNQNGKVADEVLSGRYDDYIKAWARKAKRFGKPFFLRFAHEMNGDWYAWGNFTADSPEKYKKMWIYVHDIFEREGVENAIWVWSPNNTDIEGNTDNVLDFYPGYEYVDWVGFSAFNWGNTNHWNRWLGLKTSSWKIYSILSELNKPIMLAETSSVSSGGEKGEWFWQTLHEDIPSMPLIRAVVLFNQDDAGADFSLEKGMDSVSVIKQYLIDNGYYMKEVLLNYY